MIQPIILASQSPRRRQLLEWAEIPFEVFVIPTDESFSMEMDVEEIPVHIARNKALAVKTELEKQAGDEGRTILAADTIVVLDDEVLNKPVDEQDAERMLQKLMARQHRVITGVVILHQGREIAFSDTTDVSFHSLLPEDIRMYVQKYKPFDKAGAYAIQEWIGVVGIKSIHGDFYNVMGLPISRVVHALRHL